MANRKIRVRSKRLEQISADRMALALWLMARDLAEQEDVEAKPASSVDRPTPNEETA